MPPSVQHPQLQRPLVSEALFEIRFQTTESYGIVPGRLYDPLKGTFPIAQELPAAQVPLQVSPPHLVRHRFVSQDETRMYQVGADVLSVNHVAYRGYKAFSADCEGVLAAAEGAGLLGKVTRLGLRYINKADLDRPWEEIVAVRVAAPGIVEEKAQTRQFRWISDLGPVGHLSTSVAWPATAGNSEEFMVLDFDHFKEFEEPQSSVTGRFHEWRHDAHENVYRAFKQMLQPAYFEHLQGGQS